LGQLRQLLDKAQGAEVHPLHFRLALYQRRDIPAGTDAQAFVQRLGSPRRYPFERADDDINKDPSDAYGRCGCYYQSCLRQGTMRQHSGQATKIAVLE